MKNDIDSKFILGVFEKLRQKGEHKDQHYFLEGVKGYTDFDGYTLYIEDALVQLRFGFHNQYHFEYEKEQDLERFLAKLKTIDRLD